MVVEELQTDFLREHVVGGELYSQHLVSRTRLSDVLLNLAEQCLDILVAYVERQLQVVAHFLLPTLFVLRGEVQVLDGIPDSR